MTRSSKLIVFAVAACLDETIDAQELKPTDWLTRTVGTIPIVVSAPHGGRDVIPGLTPRRGLGVPQFAVERDSNTAELANAFAGKLGRRLGAKPSLVIARFERKHVDVNRPESGAFENPAAKPFYDAYHAALTAAVSDVRRLWGGGLLLDLHGQAAERDTIFRGTDNGRTVVALERRFGKAALNGPKSILGLMTIKGYKVEPGADDRERRYTGGYTTRTYGSHRDGGIDAIQLEFGSNLRGDSNLERTADDLAHAVEDFLRSYLPAGLSAPKGQPTRQP